MKKLMLCLLMLLLALPAAAEVTLPENTAVIEAQAFLNCTELTGTLVIPEGVTEIGAEAFRGCTGLTELILPSGVTKIGERAFAGCSALTGVIATDGVTIGADAFEGTQISLMQSTPLSRFAYEVQADGTVMITGYDNQELNETVYVPDVIEGRPVTAVGADAFRQSAIGTVRLPEAVVSIGDWAFAHCGRLTAVYGGSRVTSYGESAFFYCEELSRLSINEDAALIGESAFGYCQKLYATLCMSAESDFSPESFHHSNVVALGFEVSGGEATLKKLYGGLLREHLIVPETYKGAPVTAVIADDYPYGHKGPALHLTLPSTVRVLGDYSLRACSGLVKVDFAQRSRLTEIGTGAFLYLRSLQEVVLPESVRSIGSYAFDGDESLSRLTLPDGLETLGESAFRSTVIPTINIPSAWTEIPPYAFYGMGLTEFTIPERITVLGQAALADTALTTLIIPDTVLEVGSYTFSGCKNLTTAVLPEHLEELPACAFSECTALKNVDLPDGITWIGMMAFQGCTSLEYVELPPQLTYVINCVFDECGVRTRAVERVVAACITEDMTEFEKALALHDWLINNADYSSYRTFFGAEGVLVYGEGVCQSYASAYGMLLDKVGISHYPVVSAEMDHAWNLVQLDGEWYHVDVTWDDPVGGEERHLYFGLTDELMGADHTWDNPDSLPDANGTRYQYGVDGGQ